MRPILLAAASATVLFVCGPAAAQETSVRVQLFSDVSPTSVSIIPEGADLRLFADPAQEPLATVIAGDTVRVTRGAIDMRATAGTLQINLTDLYVETTDAGAFIIQVRRPDGNVISRRFPGNLHVSNDPARARLRLVNEVDLESYVAAVVGKEYDLDADEGARAMAIVARTFAVRQMREGNGAAGDGLTSQVYQGLDAVTEESRAAAELTRGVILTYDASPIQAVYSASNGGHSADNAAVWSGEPLPYLKGHADRYDRDASPYREWSFSAPISEIHELLAPRIGVSVREVSIDERSRDGRVQSVTVTTADGREEALSGNDFRLTLSRKYGPTSLRSTRFQMEKHGDEYEFEGSGFGHGVGLSQWGAHEMSNRGYNHEEILHFYYPGTRLATVEGLDDVEAPPLAAQAYPAADATVSESPDDLADLGPGGSARILGWSSVESTASNDRTEPAPRRVGW